MVKNPFFKVIDLGAGIIPKLGSMVCAETENKKNVRNNTKNIRVLKLENQI